jgi:hypothetical protein
MKIPVPMLPVSLKERSNLSLRFERKKLLNETDPKTGNPKQELERITVLATVVFPPANPKTIELAGLNINAVLVQGFLVSPKTLPADISFTPTARIQATLTDPATHAEQNGEFILENFNTPFSEIATRIGTPIKGYFQAVGTGRK